MYGWTPLLWRPKEGWSIIAGRRLRQRAMDLRFEHGDSNAPKGHALLYFRTQGEPSKLYATYLLTLPIPIDLVKYMPPFLAPHIEEMKGQDMSAFAFPPVPEEVPSHRQLKALAEAREDDLLFGGAVDPSQVPELLTTVNEIVQAYAHTYATSNAAISMGAPEEVAEAPSPERLSGVGVDEMLYQLMSDRGRLAELARLVGKLRFACEGHDARQVQEVEEEMAPLVKHLPETYRVHHLLRAAKSPTPAGGELAQLYLERCYKLADEDYLRVGEMEERIRLLELNLGHEQS